MAGLVPAIHVFTAIHFTGRWKRDLKSGEMVRDGE
jgi:hypothetical protein